MTVYKDLKQPIGSRMEAAKAALPYENPRLASIENKIVDEFDNMSTEQIEAWLDERAEARVKVRHRDAATSGQYGRSRKAIARSTSSATAPRTAASPRQRPVARHDG